jgi:3-hydroxyacyl-[acyl-carrier-protein] dehydratase
MTSLNQAILNARCGPFESLSPGQWMQDLRLPPDFIGFAGHFPDNPLLPAFVQIRIAQTLIETALSRPLRAAAVSQSKFLRPIRPNETMTFTIRLPAETRSAFQAAIQVFVGHEKAATFRLAFG